MVDFALDTPSRVRFSPDFGRLLAKQWQETGDCEVEENPNWQLYEKLYEAGALLLVVARQDDREVGFLFGAIYNHVNAMQEKVCSLSTYFVEEGPIRALILSRMIDFALEQLAARGVFRVDAETTFEKSAGRLWESKGFAPKKIGYSLKLKAMPEVKYA
jgi:hypothetical protein